MITAQFIGLDNEIKLGQLLEILLPNCVVVSNQLYDSYKPYDFCRCLKRTDLLLLRQGDVHKTHKSKCKLLQRFPQDKISDKSEDSGYIFAFETLNLQTTYSMALGYGDEKYIGMCYSSTDISLDTVLRYMSLIPIVEESFSNEEKLITDQFIHDFNCQIAVFTNLLDAVFYEGKTAVFIRFQSENLFYYMLSKLSYKFNVLSLSLYEYARRLDNHRYLPDADCYIDIFDKNKPILQVVPVSLAESRWLSDSKKRKRILKRNRTHESIIA